MCIDPNDPNHVNTVPCSLFPYIYTGQPGDHSIDLLVSDVLGKVLYPWQPNVLKPDGCSNFYENGKGDPYTRLRERCLYFQCVQFAFYLPTVPLLLPPLPRLVVATSPAVAGANGCSG